nr:retrovirus-related Pol polyprotein from transposon TNT 1-94 [Tanacetum cinerariifolium]
MMDSAQLMGKFQPTDDELTKKELKQIEADDQAIQTILLGIPKDIYAAVDSCETAQEIWLRVQQMMKGSNIGIQEKKAKLFNEWESQNGKEVDELKAERLAKIQDPLALMVNSNNPYAFLAPQPSYNQNYMQQPMPNPEDITDPTPAMNMALALMAKVTQNPRVQNVGNQNGLIGVLGNANLNGNGNLVAACAEGNEAGHNRNQIRCYNCRGVGYFARNCTTDKTPVYDSDGSAEVHDYENCDDNEIFNMFTQEEQYTKLLEPILEPHQVLQNDNPIISEDSSVEQSGKTVEQHPVNFKETPKFVGDFKSLTKEADESLTKQKALELEIERLLRAVVSQDIMSVVQKTSIVDTSNLQTELERTKERFETCIIKKENEYAKLWNDWYKKCNECKYDKISYDKAYKDMQQKIEWLQAQLGDLKGKSKDTSCVSDILNPLSQKLENENVELEFQVLNYTRENAHLKTTYKNLFDSISMSRTQTKIIIASLQKQLHNSIYENAKLRTQLFNKVSDQKDNTRGTSANTKFAKQSIVENLLKVGETHALSKPVTLNSVPTPQESKVVKNDKVIAPGMFRINPFKTSREEKHVPNNARASARTKPIIVSQPLVFTKKDVNSDSNGLSSTGIDNIKTRRPQSRSNTKNDRVPSASKSSRSKNKDAEVEEDHRNLLFFKNTKHMSSACNNIKLDSHNVISKVVYAMCKQCLISVNHDVCLHNYVNGKNSRGKKQKANVSIKEKQKKHHPKVIQIYLWCVDSGCFKHMTRNLKLLINLVWKFMGSICFGNDHVAAILGFSDLQWGNILITRVYFVEGLGHNLFSVGQFCDSDLKVAFRRNACFVRNLEGVDLLKGDRSTNLYTINLHANENCQYKWKAVCFGDCRRLLSLHVVRTPQQNGVVERRNRTLVEAARTMLIFSRAPLFLWAEAIATACFTQNRSIIHHRFNKKPYELINGRKPDISFLHVFGALCYPKNDREDIGKLGAKAMAFEQRSLKPGLQSMTSRQINSRLDLTYAPSTITTQQPSEGELDLLFEAMYDDYIGGQPSTTARTVLAAQKPRVRQTSMASTSIADTAPTPTN